jgi:hypothetical protein
MCGCGKVKVSNFNKKRIQQRKKMIQKKRNMVKAEDPSLMYQSNLVGETTVQVRSDGGFGTEEVVNKKKEMKMKKKKMIVQKLKQVHKKMNKLRNKRMNDKSPFSHRFYLRA